MEYDEITDEYIKYYLEKGLCPFCHSEYKVNIDQVPYGDGCTPRKTIWCSVCNEM